MFYRSAGIVLLFSLTIACSRQPAAPGPERMAILRFENLGANPDADWMGRAFSEILGSELSGTSNMSVIPSTRLRGVEAESGFRPATAPGISAERPAALAAGATRLVYGNYVARQGRIDVRVTIEDTGARYVTRVLSASAPDVYAAATALAREISPSIRPYSTRNAEALHAYALALERDPSDAAAELERAIASDPNFGRAYELLARFKAQQHDVAGAEAVLQSALAREAIRPTDRAHLQVTLAELSGDVPARLKALNTLTAADPGDEMAWHSLGDSLMAAHDYAKSADAFRKTVNLDREDVNAWNQLGYALAYSGDAPAAINALRRYQTLRPTDPNAIDSMGDVSLIAGRLHDAEVYYLEADSKGFLNHADLFKAAMARLMSGDLSGADALAKRYVDAHAAMHDPQTPLLSAEWSWLSGHRAQACRDMERLAASADPALASRAHNSLALWYLMLGDRAAATKAAQQASPGPAAALSRFLVQTPAPAPEWERRAAELLANPESARLRSSLVGTALLFQKDFAAALPIFRQLYDNPSMNADPSVPYALAWSLVETGHSAEAAPLLRSNPVPPIGGPSPLASIYFPRFYYLRAVAAGNTEQARADYRLFLQLSGPNPLAWGEEQKARAAAQ